MRTALEDAHTSTPLSELLPHGKSSTVLLEEILHWLDEAKAEEVVAIDLAGKSPIGDFMIVASGRSDRHVGAIAEQVQRRLKMRGLGRAQIEGLDACDWVLLDAGDIIIHVFRPEVRAFYNLEKMWQAERPADQTTH